MKIPDEIALISLFECEPKMLDGDKVPFYYNQATYQCVNDNKERFVVSISPSYNEIKMQVFDNANNELIATLGFNDIEVFDILADKKKEARLMITCSKLLAKIDIRPRFRISMNQISNI